MHTSSQPQFQAGSMHHSATMPAQLTTSPRTSGYGPVGQAINRMHQHSQPQPFPPPPPPPHLPSPPPGTFTNPTPLAHLLPPSQTPTQATPSPSPPLRTKLQVLPPADFTPSPTHWDTRSIFGLDLPRFIKHTPHTEANHTAGMPITDLTILQTVRHGWNSYWLRYLAHGHNTGLFFTKHISENMFASEFFSALRSRKIDLDAAAIAYCHQHNIPVHTKQKALSALVTEFTADRSSHRTATDRTGTPVGSSKPYHQLFTGTTHSTTIATRHNPQSTSFHQHTPTQHYSTVTGFQSHCTTQSPTTPGVSGTRVHTLQNSTPCWHPLSPTGC